MEDKFTLPEIPSHILKPMELLVEEIESRLRVGKDASDLIRHFNAQTKRKVESYEFISYYGAMSRKEFVASTLTETNTRRDDLTDEDYLQLIQAILNDEYPDCRHLSYWLDILHVNIPCPEIMDLIFAADPKRQTAWDILEKAKEWASFS